MADATDSIVLENPTGNLKNKPTTNNLLVKTPQKPKEFVSPTPEERRKELEEVSKLVKGPIEYIAQNGQRTTFGQQIAEVHKPKPPVFPTTTPQEAGANKINHQNNVALLKNTFHKGVWYDSSGIARPKKK